MPYRNLLMVLSDMPNNAIYVILNDAKKIAYISRVINAPLWMARVAVEIKRGMFKYDCDASGELICVAQSEDRILLKAMHSRVYEDYVKMGYTVVGSKSPKFKIVFTIHDRWAIVRILDSRGKRLWFKLFPKMKDAKEWADGKSVEQMLTAGN